jgi:Domain of unknown function (DUF151)
VRYREASGKLNGQLVDEASPNLAVGQIGRSPCDRAGAGRHRDPPADVALAHASCAGHDNIFYAVLTLRIDGQPQEVDARPSDAITLALYAGAPVFVTPELLELPVVVTAPDALPALEMQNERARVEKGRLVEDPPMEWRSFRMLPDPRTAAR